MMNQFPFGDKGILEFQYFFFVLSNDCCFDDRSIQKSLVLPGTLLLDTMMGLIYALNYRLTDSTRAAYISMFLTLFAGGLGGFYWAMEDPLFVTKFFGMQFQYG
jgi:hypothetical protein